MARHPITDKNGKTTQYFWSDEHASNPEQAVVFRKTEEGVKKMRGVVFDSKAGRIVKQ